MDLQKVNVKFFVGDSNGVPLTAFINIFNSWIQASDGDYYDLADYSHMHAGPGILLIAHEANISMDNTGNRLGLLYNRKRPLQGSNPPLRFDLMSMSRRKSALSIIPLCCQYDWKVWRTQTAQFIRALARVAAEQAVLQVMSNTTYNNP